MANTNIVQFNQSKTNILDDSTYSSSIQNGIPSGLADSSLHNKLFYQLSTVIKALTDFVNDIGFRFQSTIYSFTFGNGGTDYMSYIAVGIVNS